MAEPNTSVGPTTNLDIEKTIKKLLADGLSGEITQPALQLIKLLVKFFGGHKNQEPIVGLELDNIPSATRVLYGLLLCKEKVEAFADSLLNMSKHTRDGKQGSDLFVEFCICVGGFLSLGARFSSKTDLMLEDLLAKIKPQTNVFKVICKSNITYISTCFSHLVLYLSENSSRACLQKILYGIQNNSQMSSSSQDDSTLKLAIILGIAVLKPESGLNLEDLAKTIHPGSSEEKIKFSVNEIRTMKKAAEDFSLALETALVNFGHPAKLSQPQNLLAANKMVLVTGPNQSGKSSFMETLLEEGQPHTLLYITEGTDTKALLGNYICGETVGQFEWREGPLTSIVQIGGVLVLENLQEAKDDLLQILRDILEGGFKVRGEVVKVKDSFRLIASFGVSTELHEIKLKELVKTFSSCAIVEKTQITFNDIINKYPEISSNTMMMDILKKLQEFLNSIPAQTTTNQASIYSGLFKPNILDLARLAERISHLHKQTFPDSNPIHFSTNHRLALFHLFFDVYLARHRQELSAGLLERLGEVFQLSAQELSHYLATYSSDLQILPSSVSSRRYGAFQKQDVEILKAKAATSKEFFNTSLVASLVEAILGAARHHNCMLLVGEAGSGKTTIVQETASLLGKDLHVYNMSQSSDVSDLIGGFKPLNAKTYTAEIVIEFVELIRKHFDYQKNIKLISYLQQLLKAGKTFLALQYMMRETRSIVDMCKEKLKTQTQAASKDRDYNFTRALKAFAKFSARLDTVFKLKEKFNSSLIFKFVQGSLVSALRHGDWVLLDEINLCQADVLQNILPILENKSIILIEKGELREVKRHPDFKLFGCMNPGNSVGKRELPDLIRKNFLEYFVKELEDPEEITQIVKNRSKMMFLEKEYENITKFYLKMRKMVSQHLISDGFGRKPTISLRALSRAVDIALQSLGLYPSQKSRAVIEGLYASLSSNLSPDSKVLFDQLIQEVFGHDNSFLFKAEKSSKSLQKEGFLNVEGFLLKLGASKPKQPEECNFLMTGVVKKNLTELLRVICHSPHPVLLEGPTSAGKTSMIKFLGEISGNVVVRINNHQHTDLDEYVGTYSPDETGKLVFKEGLLLEAMRKGYWIILDELNLARSEILEALNRLLDDNRELFVPEINETIVPAKSFRIFATQNPLDYGGRKELSIAFRSRFFHFFIRDLEESDLIKIVETRCQVPESRSRKLVEIMAALKNMRTRQNVFSGKESLVTIRDLLKWACREIVDLRQLAVGGYCILAERLRCESERRLVANIISEKTLSKQERETGGLDFQQVYREQYEKSIQEFQISQDVLGKVFWSSSFIRMYSLVLSALTHSEPVLLVGETGSGKTTIADLLANIFKTQLYTINCHQFSESSDFIGGLRPVRGKETTLQNIQTKIEGLKSILTPQEPQNSQPIEDCIKLLSELQTKIASDERKPLFDLCCNSLKACQFTSEELQKEANSAIEGIKKDLDRLDQLFEWVDGPLLQAMTQGGVLLIDEISLAQDSVLERLNSVLEKEKSLVLSEKGDGSVEELQAHPDFKIIATMNPSGDYGKKELTPALRNRFTEIWVEPVTAPKILEFNKDLISSVQTQAELSKLESIDNDFINFVRKELERLQSVHEKKLDSLFLSLLLHSLVLTFNSTFASGLKPLTIRDIKSSLPFFFTGQPSGQVSKQGFSLKDLADYVIILLGGFNCLDKVMAQAAMEGCLQIMTEKYLLLTGKDTSSSMNEEELVTFEESQEYLKIGKYSLQKAIKGHSFEDNKYSVTEEVVLTNLKTIFMGLSLQKAIMLEGPPGVGKTSLIQFLANKLAVKFYRVNLNEQTDLIDLLGSDVPSDSSTIFSWADGILIRAMKEGAWLLLDELNMATQTVLEGLNSILDHRGAIYLPELDQTIVKHPNFRIFASQNPQSMGSGRKGLPHSFVTRFTRIWIEELSQDSLENLVYKIYPETQTEESPKLLVKYFFAAKQALKLKSTIEWEFNLRDLHKMIELFHLLEKKASPQRLEESNQIKGDSEKQDKLATVKKVIKLFIMDRIEDESVNIELRELFSEIFEGAKFDENLRLLCSESSVLPKYLNNRNKCQLTRTINGPLLHSIDQIVEMGHPALLIHNSLSDSTTISLDRLMKVLALEHKAPASFASQETVEEDGNICRKLDTISLFSSSDLIDLVGSYEQINRENRLREMCLEGIEGLISSGKNESKSLSSNEASDCLKLLFQSYLQSGDSTWTESLSSSHASVLKIKKEVERGLGLFAWQESELCKAIRLGHWVVLKGSELVNPAILERLNGLLEDSEININEAIGSDGQMNIIKKHKNFRIFILYDLSKATQAPSRALRNRCIEINLCNYELTQVIPSQKAIKKLQRKSSGSHLDSSLISLNFDSLINSALKLSIDPLSVTNSRLRDCENLAILERIKASLETLLSEYRPFAANGERIAWEPYSAEKVAKTLNSLINHIFKTIDRRRNFSFGSKHLFSSMASVFTESSSDVKEGVAKSEVPTYFEEKTLFEGGIRSILQKFLKNYFVSFQNVHSTNQFVGLSAKELSHHFIRAAKKVLQENTREDIEEGINYVKTSPEERVKRMVLAICLNLPSSSRFFGKFFSGLINYLKETEENEQVDSLQQTTVRPLKLVSPDSRQLRVSGGFVSATNLCLNLVYVLLSTKSNSCLNLLDFSANKLAQKTQFPSIIWEKITSLFSKKTILKLKIISKSQYKDQHCLADLKDLVKATLFGQESFQQGAIQNELEEDNEKISAVKIVSEEELETLLSKVLNTIENTFESDLSALSSQFIEYETLNEETNIFERNLVYKHDRKGIQALLGFLSKNKYLEELDIGHKELRIGNFLHEQFEEARELTNVVDSVEKLFGMSKLSQEIEHLQWLGLFFGLGPQGTKHISTLFAGMIHREIFDLAKRIGRLPFSQLKLTDVSILDKLEEQLANLSESKLGLSVDLLFEEVSALTNPKQTNDQERTIDQEVEFLAEICHLAENPSKDAFENMMSSIDKILALENSILTAKNNALKNRDHSSIFKKSKEISDLFLNLKNLSQLMKSQKTRQISKYQFVLEAQNEKCLSKADLTLSQFVCQSVFKLLSKNSAFLADADIQEMNKIHTFCKRAVKEADLLVQKEGDCLERMENLTVENLDSILKDAERLLETFIKNGCLIGFGDLLIPFFESTSRILLYLKVQTQSLDSCTSYLVPFEKVNNLKSIVLTKLAENLKENSRRVLNSELVESASVYFGFDEVINRLQSSMEGHIALEKSQVDKEESLIKGKTFDEASRTVQLAKGIERAVKDEYTKQTVEANKEEALLEFKRIFGIEADLKDDPKRGLLSKQKKLRDLRVEYLKKVINGVYMSNKELKKNLKNDKYDEKAVLSILYFAQENLIDLKTIAGKSLAHSFCSILKTDISRANGIALSEDGSFVNGLTIRRTIMLENPFKGMSLGNFENYWQEQLQQLFTLEQSSFYKGNCAKELVTLREVLYPLLDKVQELREVEDLRELPSFNNIIAVSDFLLSLEIRKATLNEVCSLLERLTGYLLDYESMTPRKYHFPDLKDKLRLLLSDYRKKERKSWRGLIFGQTLELMTNDVDACIEFKNVFTDELEEAEELSSEEQEKKKRSILDLVDTFLLKSTLIQHLFRLFWVSKIVSELESNEKFQKLKVSRRVLFLVAHVVRLHLSVVPVGLQMYATNFEDVAVPIRENEKLANWHMTDLVNMKSNVTKFRKGVNRAMKIHTDVLQLSTEGQIFKRRRDGYVHKEITEVLNSVEKNLEIMVKKESEGKEEKPIPTLSKKIIDTVLELPLAQNLGCSEPQKMTLIRMLRIVPTQKWLSWLGHPKPKAYKYTKYESAVEQCETFIREWLQRLDSLKENKSRTSRFKAIEGFLKTLIDMGVKSKTSINNWDSVKTLSICDKVIDLESPSLSSEEKAIATKAVRRLYDLVDILHVHKSNLGYHTDLAPNIRQRVQNFMIWLTNNCFFQMRLVSRLQRETSQLDQTLQEISSPLASLEPDCRARFEESLLKLQDIVNLNQRNHLFTSKKIEKRVKYFKALEMFKSNKISLSDLNQKLSQMDSKHTPFTFISESTILENREKFSREVTLFQDKIKKELNVYDALTARSLFLVSPISFLTTLSSKLKSLTTRLQKLPLFLPEVQTNNKKGALLLEILSKALWSHSLALLASTVKFSHLSLTVLSSVVYSGLCVSKEDDQPEQEEGDSEYDIGTGIGEGQGDKDNTGDYQFDEQLLGTKDDDQEEGPQEDPGDEDEGEGEGEGREMDQDFEGDNKEDKNKDNKEDKKDDQEEPDHQMDQVDEDRIDQDLWDKENEEMDEDKSEQEEEERREADQQEYRDKENKEDTDKEMKGKEPNEKEERQAKEDYEQQEKKEEEEEEGKEDQEKEGEEKEGEEKEEDEFAEVESRSAMSSRNDNEDMEFDEEKPESQAEGEEGQEEEDGGFSLDDAEKMNEEDQKEDNEDLEEFDDPLNQEERKMKEEDKDQLGGKTEEKQQEIQGGGLDEKKEDENMKEEDDNPMESDPQKNEQNNKEKNQSNTNQEMEKNSEPTKEDDPSKPPESQPEFSLPQKENLALEEEDPENQDPANLDNIEGLVHDETSGELVKVKKDKDQEPKKNPEDSNRRENESEKPKLEIKQEIEPQKQKETRKDGSEEDQDLLKDGEDNKDDNNEGSRKGSEAEDDSFDSEDNQPLPVKKRKESNPSPEDDNDFPHPETVEQVEEYLNLISKDNDCHLSASSHSWTSIEPLLRARAFNLCEELRSIFKPTKIAGLRGDFRTGKRLNMRKVISYVASNYRKDKIWLRRAEPTVREHEVMLAIDDTLSMSEKNVGYLALESLITMALALTRLEVGRISIAGIRNGLHPVLPFEKPFLPSEGQSLLDNFSFSFSDKMSADLGLPNFLSEALNTFSSSSTSSKILLIISDGRCNKDLTRPMVRKCEESGLLVLYILLDYKQAKESVLNLRSTAFVKDPLTEKKKVQITGYMDDFPFRNYIVVQDLNELTSIVVDIFRDYFRTLEA